MVQVGQVTEEQRIRQKKRSAEIARKKYEYNMGVYEANASAVNPDGSRKDPKAYELYNKNKKQFDEITAEIKGYQDKLNEFKTAQTKETVTSLKDEYTSLREQLDAVVDPNGQTAQNIQKKMDSILNKYKKESGVKDDLKAKSFLDEKYLQKIGANIPGKEKTPVQKGAEALGKTPTATGTPAAPGTPAIPGKTPGKTPGKKTPVVPQTIDDVAKKAVEMGFGAIDSVFKSVPELTTMLTNAVNQKWTAARFQSELQNTNWFKTNASQLQQRGFYKRQYNDLVNALPAEGADRQTQIDNLNSTTEYGRGLARVKRLIQSEAIAEGAVIEDAALNLLAQDIYDHALENDGLAIRDYVKANIKYNPGKILSGKAGQDLADLKATAKANGLDLDKAFGSSVQGWLQKLASGESVDTYKNIIRQSAKVGMPERIASLLDNGVDLQTIYDPYRNIMASTLEINPETINISDLMKSGAITQNGETSLYDFSKMLRKDPRWQYTQQAHQEYSDMTQQILKDFGFMG